MLHEPKVMLLDEPASGMDPVSRAALRSTLEELAGRGTTVLVSSHILPELSAMCTSVGIMSKGRLVASGKIADVLNQFSAQKTITVQLLREAPAAIEMFRSHPEMQEVKYEQSARILMGRFEGNAEAQVALLADLVREGCPVQSFSEKTRDIESIILDLEAVGPPPIPKLDSMHDDLS